jgi:uncharacterized protein YidB (DUF937 family)
MDLGDIIQIGAQLFQSKLGNDGDGLDVGDIASALSGLLSDNDGNLDVSSIVSNMDAGDLISIAASWLGDGDNAPISTEQVAGMLGEDKVSSFASQLGLSQDSALSGLTEAIPNIVDKSSSGGSLLDSIGGISGAIGLASKLFGR